MFAESELAFYNDTTPPADAAEPPVQFPSRAVRCHDFHMSIRDYAEVARHLERSERLAPDMKFAPDRLDQVMACLGTPTPIANPQHRLRVRTDLPLLLVNNRHDPVTGYTMATSVARQLGPHAGC